ncbi:membrane protein insertase YidC [Endomicrobiia bacterium]|nr:membrane protein insertase YidC [Endomicrobiia bacterium]
MQKNFILFVVLSSAVIIAYWFGFRESRPQQNYQSQIKSQNTIDTNTHLPKVQDTNLNTPDTNNQYIKEEQINIETKQHKVTLTNKGAAILSWSVQEKNGQWVDLVFPESAPVMANFPDSVYKIISKSNEKIVFEYASKEGWKITKTYNLSDTYMHNLSIVVENPKNTAVPQISVGWGPGLGADNKKTKENVYETRALAYTADKPNKLKKLKTDSELASLYKWAAIDNRYFLAAFIPERPEDFDKIILAKSDKEHPYALTLTGTVPKDVTTKKYSVNFYLGHKGYTHLKTYNLDLEKTVDFGFFGFFGKIIFNVLIYFYKLTHNYGWAVIMIAAVIQILVSPLTLKSLRSAAAMKRIQPAIKDIQTKYKDNPQRLQAETLNIYRSQKVNPLGGCLPMLFQLPIFYAFFQMVKNAYELRNEGWILWIKDLSAPDQFMHFGSFNFNLLPILMGLGMLFQQKMTTATSDPTQKMMMYAMPVVFTIVLWFSPSGLVIYWITNSIFSMIGQYFVMKKDSVRVKHF